MSSKKYVAAPATAGSANFATGCTTNLIGDVLSFEGRSVLPIKCFGGLVLTSKAEHITGKAKEITISARIPAFGPEAESASRGKTNACQGFFLGFLLRKI